MYNAAQHTPTNKHAAAVCTYVYYAYIYLLATQHIHKQVIPDQVADWRNERGRQYLWGGLTLCSDDNNNNATTGYSIDAEEYGNVTRYINHSVCNMDLFLVLVFI